MDRVGKPESATQKRVIDFFQTELNYNYIGNLRENENTNIDKAKLTAWLTDRGYTEGLAVRAVDELVKAATNLQDGLYAANVLVAFEDDVLGRIELRCRGVALPSPYLVAVGGGADKLAALARPAAGNGLVAVVPNVATHLGPLLRVLEVGKVVAVFVCAAGWHVSGFGGVDKKHGQSTRTASGHVGSFHDTGGTQQ